jgi:hypothetical protein
MLSIDLESSLHRILIFTAGVSWALERRYFELPALSFRWNLLEPD